MCRALIFGLVLCVLTTWRQQVAASHPLSTPSPIPIAAEATPATSAVMNDVTPGYPFPQHATYTAGTIKPNHVTQAQLDAAVETFYEAWKREYLRNGCGADRYYVFPAGSGGGGDPNTISISEGHGYGMLITALMAGYDPNAKVYFDGLYHFFKDHPSENSSYLMAWNQVAGCSNANPNGLASATDGDMDIAYALLLADRQWGSNGPINYLQEAVNVIQALKAKVINPRFFHIMLGDWVSPDEPRYYYGTRTSDFMMNHLRAYQSATGDATWTRVIEASYGLVEAMQTSYSPTTGLLPDFIQDINTTPRPARRGYLEGANDGRYGYNACRTPWRLTTDYLLSGEPRALDAVTKINAWIRNKTGNDPQRIYDGYDLNGNAVSDYNALAFVAPFGVGAMVGANNQTWLNGIWRLVVNRPIEAEDYYGNTLKLLCLIVMSGNWWNPYRLDAQQ